ncbi:MAG: hypothetical protein ACOC9V_05410 [Chloroflexota bacterium]
MTRAEAIMLAVTMGAAARMRPNNLALRRTEIEEYRELLQRLAPYNGVTAQMMEIAPGSRKRQALLKEQIERSEADSDVSVLRQSLRTLQATMKDAPHAVTAIYADDSRLSQAISMLKTAVDPAPTPNRSTYRSTPTPTAA